MIYFYLKDAPKAGTETRLEILDASGNLIRKYSSSETNRLDEPPDPDDKKPEKEIKPEAGLNRFVWDLRYEEAHRVPGYYLWEYGSGARGPVAAPGQYQVRLTIGSESQVVPLELKLDPRVNVSPADLAQQLNMLMQVREELSQVYDAVNQIQDVRSQVAGLKRRLPENASTKAIASSADEIEKKLAGMRDQFINLTISANEDSLAYPPQIDAKLAFLAMAVGSADSAPTEAEQLQFEKLKRQSTELLSHWGDLQRHELSDFRKLTAESNLSTVVVPPAGQTVDPENTESH
jgi:hypothetical protein